MPGSPVLCGAHIHSVTVVRFFFQPGQSGSGRIQSNAHVLGSPVLPHATVYKGRASCFHTACSTSILPCTLASGLSFIFWAYQVTQPHCPVLDGLKGHLTDGHYPLCCVSFAPGSRPQPECQTWFLSIRLGHCLVYAVALKRRSFFPVIWWLFPCV